jgi:hypothetical protein
MRLCIVLTLWLALFGFSAPIQAATPQTSCGATPPGEQDLVDLAALPLSSPPQLGPGVARALERLGTRAASDEVWISPDYSVTRDSAGHILTYTHADGLKVVDAAGQPVPIPTPPAPVQASTGGAHSRVSVAQFAQVIGVLESGGDYDAGNPSGARGKYQILASNWPSWTRDAGLGWNAPHTPNNQEIVARFKFTQLFNQYGNWADVVSVWHSGRPVSGITVHTGDGYMLTIRYVNRVMQMLGLPCDYAPGQFIGRQ